MTSFDNIPKIIHQLWIGPKPAPIHMMDTWRDKNPDFEYIRWTEDEIKKRGIKFACQERIDEMEAWNGKADIMRWELLYEYGGVFLDADSVCIAPIDDILMSKKCFAGFEQEETRPGLVATGTMGFPPRHAIPMNAIEWIKKNCVSQQKTQKQAWVTVGPGMLTGLYKTEKFPDLYVFNSYTFLPIHIASKKEYHGHGKVYANQEWGSTFGKYDELNNKNILDMIPTSMKEPNQTVSVLVSSFNTKMTYINECLESIRRQKGNFGIELIWINDGSDQINSKLLKMTLEKFQKTTRFITVKYYDNEENKGLGYTLNKGVLLCSHDIIIKMDSDDIMIDDRIQKQLNYMNEHPDIKICGGQLHMFRDNGNNEGVSSHPSITWEEYKNAKQPSHWFINHPTVCYRKSAILEAGNYDKELKQMCEDFELELRMLKTHGYIYNFPEVLLKYRLHDKQVTFNGGEGGRDKWNIIRNEIIQKTIN
jgi:mannosyltransferase OCH1-like enzyme